MYKIDRRGGPGGVQKSVTRTDAIIPLTHLIIPLNYPLTHSTISLCL